MVLNLYRYLSDLFYKIPERITLETKMPLTHQIVMLVSPMTWDTVDAYVRSQRVKMGATTSAADHHHGRTVPFHNNNDGRGS